MYQCNSGNHHWINKSDAAKCCSPDWQRILVIGEGGDNPMICEGILMGRQWVRRTPPTIIDDMVTAASQTPLINSREI